LARNFASLYLGHKPKVKVATSTPHIQRHLPTYSFLKVENIVHLQAGSNVPNLDVLQLETIKTQVIA
jgi:hypothetical protein